MKNLIAVGDTHGREDWKKIIENNPDTDLFIFVGDYFDTHEDISPEQQKSNFRDLITYKKANIDKVILLFGNHDYHYLRNVDEQYSGFQMWQRTDIQELLHSALDENLMQMCYIHNEYIFSHAGVTKTWLENNDWSGEDIEVFINDLFKYKPLAFRFTSGSNHSNYGDDICQSPIWVRPKSLYRDCLDDFIQVVGHTTQDEISFINKNKIILIDTLGTSGQYLCLIDGNLTVKSINN